MRNPERIPKVLREIARIWKKHPDWRLGQLIFNIPGRDPFHIEDYDLVKLGFKKYITDNVVNMDDFPEYFTTSTKQQEGDEQMEFKGRIKVSHSMGQDYIQIHPEPYDDFRWETPYSLLKEHGGETVTIIVSIKG